MSFNAKDMTQGGQIASMRIRMFSQIANIMLYCLFIFFWILVGLVLWVKISWQTFVNGCIYWWCTTLEGMRDLIRSQPVYEIQYYGKTFRMNAAQVPTLHKLPDLVEILPEARKFGGCYVFGIQSYAQLEDIYGEKAAATLFDVMNTRAFFRSPSHKIAEFAAGEIGEKEHLKASEQYSYGADPVRDGVSTGKDMERQTLVSYSDIQSLPDLTCYVTLPGPYPAVKLSLKYQTRPKVAPEFIPRDINPEMENRLSAVLAAREAEGRQMASLFEPDVPEVVSGEDVTQAEQPQQPVSPAINDKKSDSGVNVPAGGIEQELKMKPEEEMEQQLSPGISESGEVVDMAAYEAWKQENHPDIQQQMQRREEVNINVHRERGEDVEPGDDF
ncbi:type IV secretion system DNA-binding domain-containing protein [Escherichia coli]|nr:type IV secretion system DNA-binding domain-containing protein [Escherichia coli]